MLDFVLAKTSTRRRGDSKRCIFFRTHPHVHHADVITLFRICLLRNPEDLWLSTTGVSSGLLYSQCWYFAGMSSFWNVRHFSAAVSLNFCFRRYLHVHLKSIRGNYSIIFRKQMIISYEYTKCNIFGSSNKKPNFYRCTSTIFIRLSCMLNVKSAIENRYISKRYNVFCTL